MRDASVGLWLAGLAARYLVWISHDETNSAYRSTNDVVRPDEACMVDVGDCLFLQICRPNHRQLDGPEGVLRARRPRLCMGWEHV